MAPGRDRPKEDSALRIGAIAPAAALGNAATDALRRTGGPPDHGSLKEGGEGSSCSEDAEVKSFAERGHLVTMLLPASPLATAGASGAV